MLEKQNTAAQVARLREMAASWTRVSERWENAYCVPMPGRDLINAAAVSAGAEALEREAGLMADAERWQYVRQFAEIAWFGRDEELPQEPAVYEVKLLVSFPGGSDSKPERLDAAIDAARGWPSRHRNRDRGEVLRDCEMTAYDLAAKNLR
jgi:hypothetical protein